MLFKERLKGFILGFIVAALSTSVAFAAPVEKTISAIFNNIKICVDGNLIQPQDSDGNPVEPFIYNGTTYLPVRAVGNAFGKNVKWDGNTNTVYIGNTAEGQYMSDILKPFNVNNLVFLANEKKPMGGKDYYKGYLLACYEGKGSVTFNLDGKYKSISGLIGLNDNFAHNKDVIFYADDNVIKTFSLKAGQLPQDLNLDVTGALRLKVEVQGSNHYSDVLLANLIIK